MSFVQPASCVRTRGSLRSGPSHSSLPLLLTLIRLKPSHHRDRIGLSISAVRRRLLFIEAGELLAAPFMLFARGRAGEGVRSCGYVSLALSQALGVLNLNLILIVVPVRTYQFRGFAQLGLGLALCLFFVLLCRPLCAPEGRSGKFTLRDMRLLVRFSSTAVSVYGVFRAGVTVCCCVL